MLFLSGYMEDRLAALCRDRRIPWHEVPVRPYEVRKELRLTLEDLTL